MTTLSLPIYKPRAISDPTTASIHVDRSKPYQSCPWLEEGIAFNRRSLNACLVAHHGRGFPFLCDYNGGKIDLAALQLARTRIIQENQNGVHEACRGCPHLVRKKWGTPEHAIRLIAIAQFSHCNIECSYCYLQTADPSVFAAGFDPYAVLPPIKALVRAGACAANPIVDWGGGEPTIYPEFDAVLEFLTRRGATTWIHTNGTRLPHPIRDGLPTRRIHVLCSVDAGTRETWKLIKKKDLLDIVWQNLERYHGLGCRVMLKYIMKEENCVDEELRRFIARAAKTGVRELVLDIDYDYPDPSPAVVAGLRTLERLATMKGFHVTFGSTGSLYTPEIDVAGRLAGNVRGRRDRVVLLLRKRLAFVRMASGLVLRMLRYK